MRLFRRLTLVVALVSLTVISAQESSYSDAAIQAAIDLGARVGAEALRPDCYIETRGGFWASFGAGLAGEDVEGGGFSIQGWSAMASVAWIAQEAHRRYMPLPEPGDDRIVAALAQDVFVVSIAPQRPGGVIEHVVIRPRGSRDRRQTVQPLSIETISDPFLVEGIFDRSSVIDIAERGDVEVLVIAGGREFTCELNNAPILRAYGLTTETDGAPPVRVR